VFAYVEDKHAMNTAAHLELVDRYTTDPESVYTTWFLGGEARMKIPTVRIRSSKASEMTHHCAKSHIPHALAQRMAAFSGYS
jgi:hypothetical protein